MIRRRQERRASGLGWPNRHFGRHAQSVVRRAVHHHGPPPTWTDPGLSGAPSRSLPGPKRARPSGRGLAQRAAPSCGRDCGGPVSNGPWWPPGARRGRPPDMAPARPPTGLRRATALAHQGTAQGTSRESGNACTMPPAPPPWRCWRASLSPPALPAQAGATTARQPCIGARARWEIGVKLAGAPHAAAQSSSMRGGGPYMRCLSATRVRNGEEGPCRELAPGLGCGDVAGRGLGLWGLPGPAKGWDVGPRTPGLSGSLIKRDELDTRSVPSRTNLAARSLFSLPEWLRSGPTRRLLRQKRLGRPYQASVLTVSHSPPGYMWLEISKSRGLEQARTAFGAAVASAADPIVMARLPEIHVSGVAVAEWLRNSAPLLPVPGRRIRNLRK